MCFCIRNEKNGGWQQCAIFLTLPFYFHVANIHAKYIVYKYSHAKYVINKYSHAKLYTISYNTVNFFHILCIYISHALFVYNSLK